MNYKILGSIWYTPPMPGLSPVEHAALGIPSLQVGFVAIASGPEQDDWKCYMGFALGTDRESDEQYIAGHGMKVTEAVARAHFPQLAAGGVKF